MTKWVHDDVLDAALLVIKNTCTRQIVCGGAAPTTYAGAVAAALLDAPMTSGDFTIADNDGAGGGRKLTVAAKAGQIIDASGTATATALVDDVAEKLLYVNEAASAAGTALAAGGGSAADIPAWAIRLRDPV